MRCSGFPPSDPAGPVRLDPAALCHAAGRTSLFGHPLRLLDEVSSTSDVALDLAQGGAPEGTTVIARSQLRGRGRSGRTWVSAPGAGLWFSVVLRPGLPYPTSGLLPVAIGFGVVLALRDLVLPAGLKWPNDILVGGRKVGGILVEGRSEGGCLKTAVAGVGVNWLAPDTSGEPPLTPPTGLAAELAATGTNIPSPERVLGSLLEHMEQAYLLLRSAGPAPFSAAWPRVSAHLGRPVVVQDPGPTSTPALAGPLLPDGSLEVVTAGGERRRLVSAEVRLRLTP